MDETHPAVSVTNGLFNVQLGRPITTLTRYFPQSIVGSKLQYKTTPK